MKRIGDYLIQLGERAARTFVQAFVSTGVLAVTGTVPALSAWSAAFEVSGLAAAAAVAQYIINPPKAASSAGVVPNPVTSDSSAMGVG